MALSAEEQRQLELEDLKLQDEELALEEEKLKAQVSSGQENEQGAQPVDVGGPLDFAEHAYKMIPGVRMLSAVKKSITDGGSPIENFKNISNEEGKYQIGIGREAASSLIPAIPEYAEAGARSLVGGEGFDKELGQIRKERKGFQETNPKLSTTTMLSGNIASGGALGPVTNMLGNTALGGGQAYLSGKEQGHEGAESALDTAIGGGLGLLGHGVASVAPKAIRALSDTAPVKKAETALKSAANKVAVLSLGGTPGQLEKLGDKGVQNLGKSLLEEKVVSPFKSKAAIKRRLFGETIPALDEELASKIDPTDYATEGDIRKISTQVDEALSSLQEAFVKENGVAPSFSGEEILNDLINMDASNPSKTMTAAKKAQRLSAWKDYLTSPAVSESGEEILTPHSFDLVGLQQFKRDLGKELPKNKFNIHMDPSKTAAIEDLYDAIKTKIETASNDISGPLKMGEQIKELNQRAHKFINAGKLVSGGAAREANRLPLGAYSVVAGAGAAASQGGPAGVATALASEGARRYGYSTAASAMDKLSKFMIPRSTQGILDNQQLVIAKLAASGAPDVAQVLADTIKRNPKMVGPYMPFLIESFPHLFQSPSSGYNSEIDGKIHDERDKANYVEQIGKNRKLSNTERAQAVNKMKTDGTIMLPKTGE